MGAKWEVNAWVKAGFGYEYLEVYYGPSLWRALRAAARAKRAGAGCVKVEWR